MKKEFLSVSVLCESVAKNILPGNAYSCRKPLIINDLCLIELQMGNKNHYFCKFLSRSGSGFSRQKFFLTIPGDNPIHFNRLKAYGQIFPEGVLKSKREKPIAWISGLVIISRSQ